MYLECSTHTPSLCDLDWIIEAHTRLGDDKFFPLLDMWLGKHDSSALFELLYETFLFENISNA